MFILSCYFLTLLPLVLLESNNTTDNGTVSYDATLLTPVTINSTDNEIDAGHETETKNIDAENEVAAVTEIFKSEFTLALPPRLPNHPRFSTGPFFEDGPQPQNVTIRLGTPVLLNCTIGLLYDKTVSWVRRRGDTMELLTVGKETYSVDQRIILSFRYPNNWRLQISSVTRRDDGVYECQIATHPTTVKKIFLKVLAPEVIIMDEKGRQVKERYYKAGSTVRLSCKARQAEKNSADSIVWSGGKLQSTRITTNSSTDGIVSNLRISRAQKHHSGIYTCTVNQVASASVTLHILNGELPAAIHGGCSNTMVSCIVTICLITFCSLLLTNFSLPRR